MILEMVHERAAREVTTFLAQELHSKTPIAGKIMGKIEGTEDEEEDVSIYRKSLTKRKETGNLKRKH